MVEELSHLALFVVPFLGDPLMMSALIISSLLFVSIITLVAFWRLSRKIVQLLKGQKELKTLITEALMGSPQTLTEEEPAASLSSEPEECSHPKTHSSASSSSESQQQDEESAPRTIVQTYRAGKSLYLLYSDGSVEADTDGQIQTFASIHLLKEAMARKNQNTHLRSAS